LRISAEVPKNRCFFCNTAAFVSWEDSELVLVPF